ncbi:hypothetical protein [Pedobacter ginsengisoli]|uniref:hypothetical protein n=1 Tax=Pedobacter ginsengisoli TaxID=363852 RepID=UPI00254C6740|nr:hypothetical protein [Pedobacter ginsengisoli]
MYIDGKKKVLIFRILCLIVLGGLVVRGCLMPGIQFLRESTLDEKEVAIRNEKYSKFYLSFLKKDILQSAEVVDNFSTRSKSNYLVIAYQGTHIMLHKIDLKKGVRFGEFVKLEKRSLSQSPGVAYSGSESFLYSSHPFSSVENLIITFDEKLTTQVVERDRLININFLATKSTFRYEPKGVIDMVFKSVHDNKPIPINVLLLHKGSYALLAVALPLKSGGVLRSTFIRDMLNL